MTEIQTIEGCQKRCLLTRGDHIKKQVSINSGDFYPLSLHIHKHIHKFVLLFVHLKNNVFPISFPSPLYQANTLSLFLCTFYNIFKLDTNGVPIPAQVPVEKKSQNCCQTGIFGRKPLQRLYGSACHPSLQLKHTNGINLSLQSIFFSVHLRKEV